MILICKLFTVELSQLILFKQRIKYVLNYKRWIHRNSFNMLTLLKLYNVRETIKISMSVKQYFWKYKYVTLWYISETIFIRFVLFYCVLV